MKLQRASEELAQHIARRLYGRMPGAKLPPIEDGERMWGDVDGTDEWEFCQQIAREIMNAAECAVLQAREERELA